MKDIDKLLDRYFEGETSLQEESILRQYFCRLDIEERHKIHTALFHFFSEERKEVTIREKKKKIPLHRWWAGIAAGLFLIVCIKLLYNDTEKTLVYIDGKKITDEQIINIQALNSIESISEIDEDVINSQIGILESFTE